MKMVLASNNAHKLIEFSRILTPLGYEIVSQKSVCPDLDVEENGATFAENARIKALALHEKTGLACVADDSGLCVDALNGEPGVYSARYAGEGHDDAANNAKLLEKLAEVPEEQRTARFVSSICCILADGREICCEGACEGKIAREYHGNNGFGYDPIFMVGDKSFAELDGPAKDAVSHRGRALEKLAALLK